jgi:two-component system phosphate regulon sensor histidine kinase PhoR
MSEYKKLVLIILAAVIFDIIFSANFLIIISFLLLYIFWLVYKIEELANFFDNIDITKAPDNYGRLGNIVAKILKLDNQVKLEKKKSKNIIARFNEILRNFPYPTIVINQLNEIKWIDKQAAKMFNLRRKLDVGIRINNIIRNTQFNDLLPSPDAFELQINSPQDESITLLLSVSKLTKDTRIISIRNISERVKATKLQQEFIANSSHELRTPLTVISGYLEALSLDKTLANNHQEMVSNAYEQSRLMTNMISDLLDISSLDNQIIKREQIDISQVITDVVSGATQLGVTQKITLNLADNIYLNAAFYHIYILVKNLVDNAIKYSFDDSEIIIDLNQDNNHITLSVSDNGIGIADSEIDKITRAFYRVNSTKEGSGLGLNIVDKISKIYHGKLKIYSTLNIGSTFEIEFYK